MRIPLLGGAYQAKSLIANAQRCVNLYPEANPSSSQPASPATHYPTPGLVKIGEIAPAEQPSPWVVSQSCAILKFLPDDTGNVAPTINIVGSNTQLTGPLGDDFGITMGLDFDSHGNKYVIQNSQTVPDTLAVTSVLVFSPSANGNVAPRYTISGDQTGLTTQALSYGLSICLDLDANIYVGQNQQILKFDAGSSGNVPGAVFLDSSKLSRVVRSITFDRFRNWIWVSLDDTSGDMIQAFDLQGSLRRSIQAPGYTPEQIAVSEDGSIIAAVQKGTSLGAVMVFSSNASGAATPTRQIGPGVTSNVLQPCGVGIDDTTGIIYVSDQSSGQSHRLLSFAAGATGNVAPRTVVTGNLTELALLPSGDVTAPIRLMMHA